MQIFQTRQILAIIEAKFSRENSIFSVTQHGKTKTDPQFAGLVLLLCRTKCKLIVSETSSLSSFWNYCKRFVYIDFFFFRRRDALQIQRSDDRTAMSI